MYAIRSYYGKREDIYRSLQLHRPCLVQFSPDFHPVAYRPGGDGIEKDEPSRAFPFFLLHRLHRITSYNVCYTKLLRDLVLELLNALFTQGVHFPAFRYILAQTEGTDD